MNRLEFHMIHLMPYPFIPPGEEIESTWVTLSNAHYDPKVGHRLYSEYLEQCVATEKFGYDSVIVNEHHQNAYGTMPAPNLWASYLAAKTSRIRIGIVGNALPLHANPIRVAEEIAMLDVISNGRINSGHVRGMGAEYHSGTQVPADSKEKFWEAHDLILKAWTEDGPFSWEGEHYNVNYVNPWPKPLQQPHPPIWLPGTGSTETIEEAAKRRYRYMMATTSNWFCKTAFNKFYDIATEKYGYEPDRHQLGRVIPTYVAETDAQAHREAKPHVMWFFRNGLHIPFHHLMPPGYNTPDSLLRTMQGRAKAGVKPFDAYDYDELVEQGYVVVGSPDRVVEEYGKMAEEYRCGMMISAGGHLGSMPHWMVMKNMQIMAEEVMPHFRDEGRPTWANEPQPVPMTHSEYAAQVGRPKQAAVSRIEDGAYLDGRDGHIPEVAEQALREARARGNGQPGAPRVEGATAP